MPVVDGDEQPGAEPAGSGGKGEPAGSGGKGEPAGSGGKGEPAGSGGKGEPAGSGGKGEPAGSTREATGSPTASVQQQPEGRTPGPVLGLLRRLETTQAIDRGARPLQALADAALRSPRAGDALRGTWLGHALHPLLTDFPLGAWMSASFLDLFGGPGARAPARRLVGFGLLVAVPTAASGLAEWRTTEGPGARRVGVVHAAVNTTATVLYGSSWVARRRGSHRLGVGLGVGGGLVATLGGYFGGHLSLVRKVGTADPAFGPDV